MLECRGCLFVSNQVAHPSRPFCFLATALETSTVEAFFAAKRSTKAGAKHLPHRAHRPLTRCVHLPRKDRFAPKPRRSSKRPDHKICPQPYLVRKQSAPEAVADAGQNRPEQPDFPAQSAGATAADRKQNRRERPAEAALPQNCAATHLQCAPASPARVAECELIVLTAPAAMKEVPVPLQQGRGCRKEPLRV